MRAQPVHPPGVARRLRSAGQRRIDPRRKGEDAMLKTIIRTTACLTLSACAGNNRVVTANQAIDYHDAHPITLVQGAGVSLPPFNTTIYSWPSGLKPPMPL